MSSPFALARGSLAPSAARWGGWGWGAFAARLRSRLGPTFIVVAVLVPLAGCGGDEPVTDPRPISVESPFRYPIDEWDGDVEGEVVVMVHVTDVGGVDSVYVLESSGQPALDSAALAGARELEFAPGRRGDERIAMWAKLPVVFARPDSATGGSP